MDHSFFQLQSILVCVYLAYDSLGYNNYYDFQIQQNQQNRRPAPDTLSSMGDLCKLSESYDISAQQITITQAGI